MSARAMPAMTRRIEGAVLNRRATRATTTSTAISCRSVWIVAVTGHTLLGRGALASGQARRCELCRNAEADQRFTHGLIVGLAPPWAVAPFRSPTGTDQPTP